MKLYFVSSREHLQKVLDGSNVNEPMQWSRVQFFPSLQAAIDNRLQRKGRSLSITPSCVQLENDMTVISKCSKRPLTPPAPIDAKGKKARVGQVQSSVEGEEASSRSTQTRISKLTGLAEPLSVLVINREASYILQSFAKIDKDSFGPNGNCNMEFLPSDQFSP